MRRPTRWGFAWAALACAGCFDVGAPLPSTDAPGDADAGPATPCPSGEELDAGIVSLTSDVQPIFDQYCTAGACHSATIAAANQVLVAGVTHSSIVGVPALETAGTSGMKRVEPFQPDASYLVHKLLGTHADAPALGSGERMPRGFAECLDPAYVGTIRAWVAGGALEN